MWAFVSAVLLFAKDQGCANAWVDLIHWHITVFYVATCHKGKLL